MTEQNVVDLLKSVEETGVSMWIGGGWGVDALVGFQTRPHNDIDVYIDRNNADTFVKMLKSKGYVETKTDYTNEVHTVWRNPPDCVVDLHLLDFDGTETLHFDNQPYPANILNGQGTIGGISARCFTAEAQLFFHSGYKHSEKDIHDVLLLCKTFGLDIPQEYKVKAI